MSPIYATQPKTKLMKNPFAFGLAILLSLALISCGGNSNDGIASYNNQKLNWQACDTTRVAGFEDLVEKFGKRVQCTYMRAPVDYDNPSNGEISVALLRVSAGEPYQRIGAIAVNPGGPGQDGLGLALHLARNWSESSPEYPLGNPYSGILDRYDLLGFAPRGTPPSTALNCATSIPVRFIVDAARDRSQNNTGNMLYNSEQYAAACQNNPLMPFINSDATARDMNLMRHLLGDQKLNFLMFSYGTWLGNWYASVFPDRVGRMLLIGVTDFTGKLADVMTLPQQTAAQRLLNEILIPYTAAHPSLFRMGNKADTRLVINNLSNALHAPTFDLIWGSTISKSSHASETALYLWAAQEIQKLLNRPDMTWTEASLKAEFINSARLPDEAYNKRAQKLAVGLIDEYIRNIRQEPDPAMTNINGQTAVQFAVSCNDTGTGYTAATWIQAGNDSALINSDFGGHVTDNACIYWAKPRITRPDVYTTRALMLQSENDPWTPLAGALKALDSLPNTRMIRINGEYSHGPKLPYGKACVDEPIIDYFLADKLPSNNISCQGHPLRTSLP